MSGAGRRPQSLDEEGPLPMAVEHIPVPAGAAEAALAAVLRGTRQALLKPAFHPRWSIPAQRRWLALVARLNLPPRGVAITPTTVAGRPAEWLTPRHGPARRGSVLYLHGGAYCVGGPATHRPITGT
ncbi:MAG: hypothetical protein CFE45_13110, partial [Burkholderiales bacterium PBB5]